jgi:hypothetical protein
VFGGKPGEEVVDYEGNRIGEDRWAKAPRMGYEIVSGGSSYTGSIAGGEFAVIPLFREKWAVIATQWGKDLKNPKKPVAAFDSYTGLTGITAQIVSGEGLTWNIIGNSVAVTTNGDTFGISGKLLGSASASSMSLSTGCIAITCAAPVTVLNMGVEWDFREYSNGVLSQSKRTVGSFLSGYRENYLILYNTYTTPVSYAILAPSGEEFTFPATRINAMGKVRDSLVRLELSEAKSSIYDILKYSLFVK